MPRVRRKKSQTSFVSRAEQLEARMMLAGDVAAFQNPINANDVSANGVVTPADAFMVIKDVLANGVRPLSMAEGEPEGIRGSGVLAYIDVNGDGMASHSDAMPVIRALNGVGAPGDVLTYTLEITDLDDNPITTIEAGNEFKLRVLTEHSEATSPGDLFGVFSAFLDVEYDAGLVSVVGELEERGQFTNAIGGDTSVAGLIDEAGGLIDGTSPNGRDPLQLFTVRMRANAAGNLTVTSNAADDPASEVLAFSSNDPVAEDDILFGTAALTITGGDQETAPDLVQFARDLEAAGVLLYTSTFFSRGGPADQFAAFGIDASFLPIVEVFNEDGTTTTEADAAGISLANTWVFSDTDTSDGQVLSLAEISTRSGVPIPDGFTPSIAPIDDVLAPEGAPLQIPLDGYDPNGDPLQYTVTIDDPALLTSFIPEGNRSLRITASDDIGNYGEMVFQLFEGEAPRATEQFIDLASRDPSYFNDVIFHRVIDGFVIQGGDPTGSGSGGSDLPDFEDQFSPNLLHTVSGLLSMAKTVDDTNNSQFFVTESATRHLDFNHTIFGVLVEGDSTRESISNVETGAGDRPVLEVKMSNVGVLDDLQNGTLRLTALAATGTTNVTVTATDTAGNSTSETFAVTLQPDLDINDNVINSSPYLEDIPEQVFEPAEDIEFTLSAIDVDADQIFYGASTSESGATVEVSDAGVVTVTPPAGFVGILPVQVAVAGFALDMSIPERNRGASDNQLVNILVAPGEPTSVDLLDSTDSGLLDDDNITNITELEFDVTGVADGATVLLFADDTQIGEGVATGATITITNANISALGSGTYAITAVQEVDGERSQASPALNVTLDQVSPVSITNEAPAEAETGELYTFDPDHPDEAGNEVRYSLSNAPTGMEINEFTGIVTWTPNPAQRGSQSYDLVLTDVAGNTTTETIDVVVGGAVAQVRLVATDLAGNPIGGVAVGGDFLLQAFVADQREAGTGISSAFIDFVFVETAAMVNGDIDFASGQYSENTSGTITGGFVDELGGTTTEMLGGGEQLLATIPMQATVVGLAAFTAATVDGDPIMFADGTTAPTEDVTFINATLSILNVNDTALEAVDDTLTVDEDTVEARLLVLDNDQLGPTSEIVSITSSTDPDMNGTAFVSSDRQAIIYTPEADFFGTETLEYTIRDSQGVEDTAMVTITVDPVNDPPIANPDFYPDDFAPDDNRILLLVEDATTDPIGLPVLGNESNGPDDDGDNREIVFVSAVDGTNTAGSLEFEALGVNYTPAPNFSGTDTFTYTITDQHDLPLTSTATVTVVVAEVNDAPTTTPDSFEVTADTPLTILANEITANDSAGPLEDDQALVITEVVASTSQAGGQVEIDSDGNVVYTPPSGFTGSDSFTYTITDDGTTQGNADPLTATGTVLLTVGGGTEPVEAFDDAITIANDGTAQTLELLGNDRGTPLTISELSATSAGGTATIINAGAQVTYMPAAGFTGTDTFTYTITDGTETDTGTVTVTVVDEATATNSSFQGLVFFDSNDDGLQDANEMGIGGMTIRLSGTADNGVALTRSAVTDMAGNYSFSALPQGTFTISQEAANFLEDGIDISDEDAALDGNDAITITVGEDVVAADENTFGERGLSARFAALEALASSRGDGLLTEIVGGQSQWVRPATGWEGFSSIAVTMSDDLSEVTITTVDGDSVAQVAVVPMSDRSRVQIWAREGDARLMRIAGSAAEFNFTPVADQTASGVASAVDALMATL